MATLLGIAKRQGISRDELKALRESLKELHALFAEHVAKGEALMIHGPHLRRFTLAESGI